MQALLEIVGTFWILGLMILGIVQPFSAVIRLITVKRWDSTYAIGLRRYVAVVFSYFAIMKTLGIYAVDPSVFAPFFYVYILPALIAWRYYRHVSKWDKAYKNIESFDNMKTLEAPHPDRLELMALPTKKVKLAGLKKKVSMIEMVA